MLSKVAEHFRCVICDSASRDILACLRWEANMESAIWQVAVLRNQKMKDRQFHGDEQHTCRSSMPFTTGCSVLAAIARHSADMHWMHNSSKLFVSEFPPSTNATVGQCQLVTVPLWAQPKFEKSRRPWLSVKRIPQLSQTVASWHCGLRGSKCFLVRPRLVNQCGPATWAKAKPKIIKFCKSLPES